MDFNLLILIVFSEESVIILYRFGIGMIFDDEDIRDFDDINEIFL